MTQSQRTSALIAVCITITLVAGNAYATYSPSTGRWVERDPAGYVDGMNRYEGVYSSPLNHTDPTGLSGGPIYLEDVDGRHSRQVGCGGVDRCGPDVTDWFVNEIVIYRKYVAEVRRKLGSRLSDDIGHLNVLGPMIRYKKTNFSSRGCPRGRCRNTVTLCGRCIDRSELGNMMFGIIAYDFNLAYVIVYGGAWVANLRDTFTEADKAAIDMGFFYNQWMFEQGRVFDTAGTVCEYMNARDTRFRQMTTSRSRKCEPCNESVAADSNHSKPGWWRRFRQGKPYLSPWMQTPTRVTD